jgi:hypothetical protein
MINELIRGEFLRGDAIFIGAVSGEAGRNLSCIIVEIIHTVGSLQHWHIVFMLIIFMPIIYKTRYLRDDMRNDVNDIIVLHIQN